MNISLIQATSNGRLPNTKNDTLVGHRKVFTDNMNQANNLVYLEVEQYSIVEPTHFH